MAANKPIRMSLDITALKFASTTLFTEIIKKRKPTIMTVGTGGNVLNIESN